MHTLPQFTSAIPRPASDESLSVFGDTLNLFLCVAVINFALPHELVKRFAGKKAFGESTVVGVEDVRAYLEPDKLKQFKRPHRQSQGLHRFGDYFVGGAGLYGVHCFAEEFGEKTIYNKSGTVGRDNGGLAQLSHSTHRCCHCDI